METISQRVKQYIDYKGLAVSNFEKQIEAGNNSIGTSIKRNSNLTGDLISKILNTFSEINPEWLLTGKGGMLKPNDENVAIDKTEFVYHESIQGILDRYSMKDISHFVVENSDLFMQDPLFNDFIIGMRLQAVESFLANIKNLPPKKED